MTEVCLNWWTQHITAGYFIDLCIYIFINDVTNANLKSNWFDITLGHKPWQIRVLHTTYVWIVIHSMKNMVDSFLNQNCINIPYISLCVLHVLPMSSVLKPYLYWFSSLWVASQAAPLRLGHLIRRSGWRRGLLR